MVKNMLKEICVLECLEQAEHLRMSNVENQDGGIGRHTVPPRTPELTENRMARKSDTKEIKNKHSSRPVGGAETGSQVERTQIALVGPRLAECGTNGTNGADSLTTSRPCGPTVTHR